MLLGFRTLFSRLRGPASLWAAQVAPSGMADMPSYLTSFAACAELSRRLGAPSMSLCPTGSPSNDLHDVVGRAMKLVGVETRHLPGMAGQCLKWSHFLAPAIADVAGTAAWPTLGQFWKNQTQLFGMAWPTLHEIWRRGAHPADLAARGAEGLNWHAWITLATGEIIDLTFPSTLAAVHPSTHGMLAGRVACGVADEIFPDHRYYPMLAGSSVIEALQARSTMPFLADDVDDLALVQRAIVPFITI